MNSLTLGSSVTILIITVTATATAHLTPIWCPALGEHTHLLIYADEESVNQSPNVLLLVNSTAEIQTLFCLTRKTGHFPSDIVHRPAGCQGPQEELDNLIFNISARGTY